MLSSFFKFWKKFYKFSFEIFFFENKNKGQPSTTSPIKSEKSNKIVKEFFENSEKFTKMH